MIIFIVFLLVQKVLDYRSVNELLLVMIEIMEFLPFGIHIRMNFCRRKILAPYALTELLSFYSSIIENAWYLTGCRRSINGRFKGYEHRYHSIISYFETVGCSSRVRILFSNWDFFLMTSICFLNAF